MAQSPLVRFLLLKYVLLLFISTCLCQRDCTGVDCPVLDNCIEEVLENGACCATCAQTGCMCEGYQFYDCVAAGFRNGKVPEGESYFVDFGSTECSCPEGGGRISCHFIPCPEIPANCIEVSEPADGCVHCERVGCVHEEQKYEAGHSFHMDPCQVCHCPNDGGKLMCYPIPDCDPQNVQKPILATTTEENTPEKHNDPIQYIFSQQGPREHLSKPFQASHHDSLPPFKLNPSHMDEEDDYDYSPTDASEPSLHDLTSPTESSIISVSHSENYTPHEATIHRGAKQELRERFGIQEASTDTPTHKDRTDQNRFSIHRDGTLNFHEDITSRGRFAIHRGNRERERFDVHKDITNVEMPAIEEGNRESEKLSVPKETTTIETSDIPEDATNSIAVIDSPPTEPPTTPQFLEETTPVLLTTEKSVSESPIYPHTVETVEQDNTTVDNKKQIIPLKNITGHDGKHGHGLVSHDRKHLPQNAGGNTLSSVDDVRENIRLPGGDHGKPSKEHKLERKHERHMFPVVKFSPSSQPPLRVKADEGHPPNKQSQSLLNFRTEEEEEREERDNTLSSFPKAHKAFSVVPDPALLENCCEKGKKWASENQHCNHMSVTTEEQTSVCSAVQKQCCLGSLREDLCLTGVKAAKAGEMCEEQDNQHCVENSQKECCSCCALGLHFRREGRGCEAHQYLLYPCGHVFLTCCEEEEEGEEVFGAPTLRKKERPRPTAIPQKVLDSKFLKEAFSISASEDAANSVEDLEDVDECQRHEGRLCSHTCINTWGSYKCTCHAGYKLQQDGHTCVPESPEEENRVREDNRPVTVPVPQQETAKELSSVLNPCEGNSLCMHRCSVVGGRARCSCFPGFSLMADGHTCEDVNECVTNTHTCQANERCVNTIGAFMCERQISCPAGYQLRNGVCEDIDECMVRIHNCSAGFECQNTDGSFHCSPKQRCLTGFTQDAHGNCVDINECTSVSEPCRAGFNCINTVGSYTCQRKIIICGQGYHSSPDGTRCIDVDECQTGIHRCGEGQICHNLPGSYRCDCQTGYQYDAIRQLCLDVNECWRYPGRLCAQTCENTPGSYQCSCTAGFSLAFDGKNCEDLNECDNNPCSQECANIYGSYQCYCRQGFYLKEDGHTCEDIDECSQSIGHLCAFQCVNVPGSYTCACPTHGYSMSPNGRTCRDIDECAIGAHNCSAGQTCYNIQGSFRCLSFTCPENYRKVSDTRCERVGCPNFQDCQNMPLRITYYQLSFQTNIVIPAQIFRIGPSPAYSGDNIIISIPRGNEEGYFSTRRLNSFTGAVYLQRQVREPRDFFIDVEMKLLRQGTFTTFLARIYVFITANSL